MTNTFIDTPVINVGIMSAETIDFNLNGCFSINNTNITAEQNIKISNRKILFNDKAYETLTFVPKDKTSSFTLIGVTIGKNFHWQQKENQTFRGALKFITEEDSITAINIIPVEDYLTSVISSEMSATSSSELLKAHAIISRSWLLSQIGGKGKKNHTSNEMTFNDKEIIKWYDREDHCNFDVCADDHCQRYQGITRQSTSAVEDAIEKTAGMVLMCNEEICDARFSKSCGGVSELFENCWENTHFNYLEKVIDSPAHACTKDLSTEDNAQEWIRNSQNSFCNTSDKNILTQVLNSYDQETPDFYRWKVEYTQETLSDLIKRKTGIDFGLILDLTPIERGVSGRLIKLKIEGTKRTLTIGKELEIRKVLSESHLYSSAFVIDKSPEKIPAKFTLTGAGWGHGVGLCQIGAAVMASKGYNYVQILQHYYPNTTIEHNYGNFKQQKP